MQRQQGGGPPLERALTYPVGSKRRARVVSGNESTASQRGKEPYPHGSGILHNPRFNKGTAFSEVERDALKIRGLLPPRVCSQKEQQTRVLGNFRRKNSDLEKHIFMV